MIQCRWLKGMRYRCDQTSKAGGFSVQCRCSGYPNTTSVDWCWNPPHSDHVDLFTIMEAHGKIGGLNVVLVGDLRYGRTVHSLSHALIRFGAKLTLVSPETLSMPEEIVRDLRSSGAEISENSDLSGSIPDADVIYMTRIQKERFPDEDEYAKVAGIYTLGSKDMHGAKDGMIVMHPLPRVGELHPSLDSTPMQDTSSKHSMGFQHEWPFCAKALVLQFRRRK